MLKTTRPKFSTNNYRNTQLYYYYMMGVQLIPPFSSMLSAAFFYFFLCPSEEELGAVVVNILRGDINRSEESKETVIAGRFILSEEFESSPISLRRGIHLVSIAIQDWMKGGSNKSAIRLS
jgi:hypothetical protein